MYILVFEDVNFYNTLQSITKVRNFCFRMYKKLVAPNNKYILVIQMFIRETEYKPKLQCSNVLFQNTSKLSRIVSFYMFLSNS